MSRAGGRGPGGPRAEGRGDRGRGDEDQGQAYSLLGNRVIHDLWYKNAVIYCLNVETFLDSNGDGVGDFVGLTDKLRLPGRAWRHLPLAAALLPSPNRDDGYDVSDYYGVHPRTGTFGDFVEFMNRAQQLGLRVIVDLVVNHTSDQHPWFKAARTRSRVAVPRLLRLVEDAAAQLEQGDGVSRRAEGDVDARSASRRRVLLPPLLRLSARPQHAQPRREGGVDADHGVLAAARRVGLPHGRGAVPDRAKGRRTSGRRATTSCCTRCATSCSGGAATRSCSPKPTCRRGESLQYFGERRRPAADDAQLLGQPADVLHAGDRRHAAAARCARSTPTSGPTPRSGACSCARTTSSISDG